VTSLQEWLNALWWLIKPSTLVLILLSLGLLFMLRRVYLPGFMLLGSATGLVLLALLPTASLLTEELERRYSAPVLPEQVDGIIVLGGGGIRRLRPFAELALRYPTATLVFSGGGDESRDAYRFLSDPADLAERTIYENRSQNTYENALFSYEMLSPSLDETWLLVTSASHMPRSVATFARVGWSVIPYPVDYQSTIPTTDLSMRFQQFDSALREWLSTGYFYLAGFTQNTEVTNRQTITTTGP
jgi:uncharacterized SAM-binding protein YcdF (DUF218 family)